MPKFFHSVYFVCIFIAVTGSACSINPAKTGTTPDSEPLSSQVNPNDIDKTRWPERTREVLVNALSLTGVRYQYGGNSPDTGFDCSGFVRYVFQQAGNLSLPHGARAISELGKTIPRSELQPGDLVFFNTLKSSFSHVGIYLGNNRFIHSPSSGGAVRIEDMQSGYWQKRFNGAQRIETLGIETQAKGN